VFQTAFWFVKINNKQNISGDAVHCPLLTATSPFFPNRCHIKLAGDSSAIHTAFNSDNQALSKAVH
jgi:hypothetical protein